MNMTCHTIVKRDASGSFNGNVISAAQVNASAVTASNGVFGSTSGTSGAGVSGQSIATWGIYGTSSGSQAIWGESFGTGYTNGPSSSDGIPSTSLRIFDSKFSHTQVANTLSDPPNGRAQPFQGWILPS